MKKYHKKSPFKDEEHLLYLEVSLGNTKAAPNFSFLFFLLSSFLSFFFLLLFGFYLTPADQDMKWS
jgi:hypothetical protein